MDIKALVRENIRNLSPYSTARDDYQGGSLGIFLDANENPYESGYNRYPDPHQLRLKRVISKIKGVDPSRIFIGNGSDEPIDLLFRTFCEPRQHNVVSIAPTYGMYTVAAAINDVEFREVALKDDFSIDREAMLAATDSSTRMIFLCSPNNPTGNLLAVADVEYLIANFNGVVVIDEAYIDFASDYSFLSRLDEFDNLVILQTLSKAWGMAGLRLGLAFASEYIIETISKVKYPYNINIVTQALVEQLLANPIDSSVAEICSQRERVAEFLSGLSFVRRVYPSDANFLLVEFEDSQKIYDVLVSQGVIVRDRSRLAGCANCLRITIGTPEENSRLIEIMNGL